MGLCSLAFGTGSGSWSGGQHAEADHHVTMTGRRLTVITSTSVFSSSTFRGLIIGLLLLTSIAAASAQQDPYAGACAGPCPQGQICLISQLYDPRVGGPSGYCVGENESSSYCEYNGRYFAVDLRIPKGDGCSTCLCYPGGRLLCRRSVCGRAK